MTKRGAVALVASHWASIIDASDFEECTGLTPIAHGRMSEADLKRLDWAIGEVARRLRAMGTQD